MTLSFLIRKACFFGERQNQRQRQKITVKVETISTARKIKIDASKLPGVQCRESRCRWNIQHSFSSSQSTAASKKTDWRRFMSAMLAVFCRDVVLIFSRCRWFQRPPKEHTLHFFFNISYKNMFIARYLTSKSLTVNRSSVSVH